MNDIIDLSAVWFDKRRERRIAELRQELELASDRLCRRLLEKELAATVAASAAERERAAAVVSALEGGAACRIA